MSVWGYIKAYWWVAAALALLALGYAIASQRMKVRALEMQAEALQALRDSKKRRTDRDKAIDTASEKETAAIVEERDTKLEGLEKKEKKLDATGADHDALDAVDDEVNAYLRGE